MCQGSAPGTTYALIKADFCGLGTTYSIINVGISCEGTEYTQLGPDEPRIYSDLSRIEKDRCNADIPGQQKYTSKGNGEDAFGRIRINKEDLLQLVMGEHKNRVGNAYNPGQARQVKCYNCNEMLLMQAQENGVVLDEEQLLFLAVMIVGYDSDVDEAPTAQTMFMANLSSADPVCNEAGPSYDSDVLSESLSTPRNTVANNLLNAELATYKEHVGTVYGKTGLVELK
ncbi:hypothetical protein Tco_1019216 [Tanacetum coccineum]|uniref:Uncharacterized protein n=1 Tax=Tanacetum coccineum TaxID=301880 RepID=A0ABQ5FWK8_9ASTR